MDAASIKGNDPAAACKLAIAQLEAAAATADSPTLEPATSNFLRLLCLPPGPRAEAQQIADLAEAFARCLELAAARDWHPDLPALSQAPAELVIGRLVEEGERLGAAAALVPLAWLLKAVHDLAEALEGPGGPTERAAMHVLRPLCGDHRDPRNPWLAGVSPEREEALDRQRLDYSPADADAYLAFVTAFYNAFHGLPERQLARHVLSNTLAVHRHAAASSAEAAERLAYALTALGYDALRRGTTGLAVPLFEELRRLVDAGICPAQLKAEALMGIGRAWLELGDLAHGVTLVRAGLEQAPAGIHRDARLALYEAALDMGDTAAAMAVHEALIRYEADPGTSKQEIEGRELEADDPAGADALYRQVLDGSGLRRTTLRRVVPRRCRMLLAQGDAAGALRILEGAWDVLTSDTDSNDLRLSDLDELAAAAAMALGRAEDARGALYRATARDSRGIVTLLAFASARLRARLLLGPRRRAEMLVGLVIAHFAHDEESIGAAHAIVNRRKGLNTSIEQRKAQRVADASRNDPVVAAARCRLGAVRVDLARAALAAARGGAAADALEQAIEEREALERELAYLIGGVGIDSLVRTPNPFTIAMCIPEGSAYVEVVRYAAPGPAGEARYAAFVLHARYAVWRIVDLGRSDRIDTLVDAVRAELGVGDARDGFATEGRHIGLPVQRAAASRPGRLAPGRRLRRRTMDRLEPALEGRTRVVLSLDGALHALPLECLPDEAGGHLIDRYRLSYASSEPTISYMGADIIYAGDEERPPPLVIGDPDYGAEAPDRPAFRRLAGSRNEAVSVGRVLGVEPLLDGAASKAALTAAASPLILHLATHGYVLGAGEADPRMASVPLARVGLALADANGSHAEAGLITGEEVLSLDLRRTALTVLSACETGLGQAEQGEGLASLGRAFEAAGSRAVIMGLWKVPDAATGQMMAHFHARLAAGTGCADALREAKLATRTTNPDVADWGAFVCLGGWGSIAVGAR